MSLAVVDLPHPDSPTKPYVFPSSSSRLIPSTALSQALTQHGGELQLKSVVRRLTIENGSVRGVVLENGQRIAAPLVISNADAKQTFEELAGLEHLPARFVRNLRAMRPSVSAFVVYAATSLDLRAAGACHEMFAYDLHDHDADYANLLRGEITRVGITVPTLADPGLAPPDEHLVALTVLLPQSLSTSWRAEKDHYTELLLSKAERVFPGFREHLRFAEGSTPRTLERYTRNFAGAMYGWELTPGQTGPLRLDIETPIAGLYLAGHWTQPGSGVYGVVASGVRAAQAVLGFAQEPDFWAAIEGRAPGTRPTMAARSAGAAPT